MPPLSMFGRHWRISSDDFVCPAAVELVVRSSWIVILVFVLVFHIQEIENLECLGGGLEYQLTTYYLCISLGLLSLTCVLNLLLMCHSARGKIVEAVTDEGARHPRAWVPILLYINIILTVFEFVWTGFGLYFTIEDFILCMDEHHERTVIIAVLVIIALFYILLIIKIFLVICSFRPYAKIRSGERRRLLSSDERRSKKQENLNYFGLRCIAPCTSDEDTIQAFKDIAGLLSIIFGDRDLVPSDILAGLIILSHGNDQSRAGEGAPGPPVVGRTLLEGLGVSLVRVEGEGDTRMVEIAGEETRIRLDWVNIKHYYKFAAAAYGYMWWMLQSPLTHCCKLGWSLQCSACCGDSEELFVEGDGVFRPNYAAIKAMLDIDDRDIIVFDNRNMIEEVPFLLVADKSTRSLIISIRGTLSLHDMLTDLRGEPGVILDSQPEWLGHQGMVNAARYVYMRLHGQVTEREMRNCAQSDRSSRDSLRQRDILQCCLTDPEYEGFDIVVTGHSLGAGTATILAFLLRDRYPDIRVTCYAYSPPGGLLSLAAAKESEKFSVSVIVGDDVIPRLSLTSIGTLSRDIKQIITACSLPKYQVFGYGCMACCCKRHTTPLSAELARLFPPVSPEVETSPAEITDSKEELLPCPPSVTATADPPSLSILLSMPAMFLPGRVIHITESQDTGAYSVTEQERATFKKILVSPRMLTDHFPNNLHKVLESCPEAANVVPVLV